MKCFTVFQLCFAFLFAVSANAETITIEDAQLLWVDNVVVSSRDTGVVKSVEIRPNDKVTQDTLVVELDDDVQARQAEGAEKQLAIAVEQSTNDVNLRFAEKSAEVAKKELERARAAVAQYARAVSQSELEKTQLELEQTILSGEQAKHELSVSMLNTQLRQSELDLAKLKLKQRAVLSPIDGQIAEIFVQKGEWVDLGTPVVRIVNLNKLRVVALVPETHLFSIKNGQDATVRVALGAGDKRELSADGKVSFVSPEVNPVNREFLIWVDIENKEQKLRPGLVGTLTLETDSGTE